VVAAGMSGKIKTVLQMVAVPMLLLVPVISWQFWVAASMIVLWASLLMTVYSGVEYIYQNRKVFTI
jgi:CDP-diacylglycerol--glycerol-3-phosphate 3-phosphatidyltransferase/cardiolipin synthase